MAQHGYISKNYVRGKGPINVLNGSTLLPISDEMPMSDAQSLQFLALIKTSSIVLGPSETLDIYLQKILPDGTWANVDSVVAKVSLDNGDGWYCLVLSANVNVEALHLPLTGTTRLVASSGSGSSATITDVYLYNRV